MFPPHFTLSPHFSASNLTNALKYSVLQITFQQYYLKNTKKFETDFIKQLDALTELIYYEFDGGYWGNEFGSISSNFYEEEKTYDFMENGYCLRFFPSQKEDIIFFKILPVHPQFEANFLQSEQKTYDGFICSHSKHRLYKHRLLPKPIPYSFCHYEDVLSQQPMVVYLSSTNH